MPYVYWQVRTPAKAKNYKFGFNGLEKDNEVYGDGNTYNTELRSLDVRLGRWFSLDPMMAKFPWQSPYVSMDNNPIAIVDPTGGEGQDWYKDANGENKYDKDVHSQADLDARGIKGTYLFESGYEYKEKFDASNNTTSGTMTYYGANGTSPGSYSIKSAVIKARESQAPDISAALPGITGYSECDNCTENGNAIADAGQVFAAGTIVGAVAIPAIAEITLTVGTEAVTEFLIEEAIEEGIQQATGAPIPISIGGGVSDIVEEVGENAVKSEIKTVAKVHGNSLSSQRPTWGYKLYSNDGTFLKNGITSKTKAEARYSKRFMNDKYMITKPFPNRKAAYEWEYQQNQIMRGPLNKNNH